MSDAERNADFVTIISTELIAQVMQRYFNDELYKRRVEIVDSKATSDGYMFSLAFVTEPTERPSDSDYTIQPVTPLQQEIMQRLIAEQEARANGREEAEPERYNIRDTTGRYSKTGKLIGRPPKVQKVQEE